jgi:hypothetical protein
MQIIRIKIEIIICCDTIMTSKSTNTSKHNKMASSKKELIDEDKTMMDVYEDQKFFNDKTFSDKTMNKKGKTGPGRPISPLWHLSGRINAKIINGQQTGDDYSLYDRPPKIVGLVPNC